jgi:hypothetical protein
MIEAESLHSVALVSTAMGKRRGRVKIVEEQSEDDTSFSTFLLIFVASSICLTVDLAS